MSDNIVWILIGIIGFLIFYIGIIQSKIIDINRKLNLIDEQLGLSNKKPDELK